MTKRILVATVAAGAISAVALAGPAGASTQTIDATVASVLQMTTTPNASVSGWALAGTGANTTSGGSMAVNANQPWTVTATGDKSRLTEYVTATSSYVASSPRTLTSPLSVISTRTGGTSVVPAVAATAVVGTSSTLATGTGLGTDTFDITLSQPTAITDPTLPSGRTYHMVVTYTLSSTL